MGPKFWKFKSSGCFVIICKGPVSNRFLSRLDSSTRWSRDFRRVRASRDTRPNFAAFSPKLRVTYILSPNYVITRIAEINSLMRFYNNGLRLGARTRRHRSSRYPLRCRRRDRRICLAFELCCVSGSARRRITLEINVLSANRTGRDGTGPRGTVSPDFRSITLIIPKIHIFGVLYTIRININIGTNKVLGSAPVTHIITGKLCKHF